MRSWPVILAVMVALPAAALAEIGPSASGRTVLARFKAMDRDTDRGLSLAELRTAGGERAADTLFLMLDGDNDGRLSLREVEGAGGGGRVARFEAYDVDRNGYVVRREFPRTVDPRLFDALDRDGDRRLSLSEIRPAFAGAKAVRQPVTTASKTPGQVRDRAEVPTCWVPNFGAADRWLIEVPVIGGAGCRTR